MILILMTNVTQFINQGENCFLCIRVVQRHDLLDSNKGASNTFVMNAQVFIEITEINTNIENHQYQLKITFNKL